MSQRPLRIALVAPLHETVPPRGYGGTERVLHFLAEALVHLGHSVTLYAARGSRTSAKLIESWPGTFRETGIGFGDDAVRGPDTAQLQQVFCRISDYDIVHIHHGSYQFHTELFAEVDSGPYLWTEHGNVHVLDKPEIFKALGTSGIAMIAISQSQRDSFPEGKWIAVVQNGIPAALLSPPASNCNHPYLAFLGRVAPDKGVPAAVRISVGAGLKLKVAAKIDDIFEEYYDSEVEPLFDRHNVEFVGEIGDHLKSDFLGNAVALVFPIQWLEPFGLVMIEAMACGTPVIAFNRGAVSEVLEHGKTGFIVDTEVQAVEALQNVGKLDRKLIRKTFEQRFTAEIMARNYVEVYERFAGNQRE